MTKYKKILIIATVSCALSGCSTYSHLDETSKEQKISTETVNKAETDELQNSSALTVSPLHGFDVLFDEFVKYKPENRLNNPYRNKFVEDKKAGGTKWGAKKWMKDKSYYESLDMNSLVKECFEKPIFMFEVTIYKDKHKGYTPLGLISLEVYHNGFSELFKRDDYYKGILFLYNELTSKIKLDAALAEIVTISGTFDAMPYLYLYSPLKAQIKGRREQFFDANVKVIEKYRWFLENFDYKTLGTEGSAGFYREPCTVVQTSLLLLSQIDKKKFHTAKKELSKVRWDKSQDIDKLKDYLDLALKHFKTD